MADKVNEIAHLMKYGGQAEVIEYFHSEKKNMEVTWPAFIDQMIDRAGIKRTEIAYSTGLSRDYLYKLLRGDKRTSERDYIIAICFALHMSETETQHALSIYPLPPLDESDGRSGIILSALRERLTLNKVNTWLEKAGYPQIKISPDMESAKVQKYSAPVPAEMPKKEKPQLHESELTGIDWDLYEEENEKEIKISPFFGIKMKLEADKPDTFAVRCGDAPFDYAYFGEVKVTDVDDKQVYYAQGIFDPMFTVFQLTAESMFGADGRLIQRDTPPEVYEDYICLDEAGTSPFFKYYMEVDKATDKKVIEVMNTVDDTKYYRGAMRYGSGWHDKAMIYIEMFNTNRPEYSEYLQVTKFGDGSIRYSASHTSAFMQIELGVIYDAYWPNKEKVKYYIDISDLRDLDEKYSYFYDTYKQLQTQLTRMAKEYGGLIQIKDDDPDLTEDEHNVEKIIDLRAMYEPREEAVADAIAEIRFIDRFGKERCIEVFDADDDLICCLEEKSLYDIYLGISDEKVGLTIMALYRSLEEAQCDGYRRLYKVAAEAREYVLENKCTYEWKPGQVERFNENSILELEKSK